MPRVVHVLPETEKFSEFHGGAISRWVANVLRGDASGHVMAVDADDTWQHPASQIILLHGLYAYRSLLKLTRHRIPWVLRRFILRRVLQSIPSQLKPGDVVWVHNRPDFAAALAARVHLRGGLVVLHMHNTHLQTTSRRILEQLKVDHLVFVSQYLKQASLPSVVHTAPSDVLYNGADGTLFRRKLVVQRPEGSPLKVLFASRVVQEKGAHVLSAALRQLHQEDVSIEGIVVGGADFGHTKPSQYIEKLIRDAPCNLKFLEYCSGEKLARLFRDADIFCLPSVWHDPFPLAPLEAMAAGLPVVASRSGGIPEALQYGGGMLVERDSVASLSDALRSLTSNASLRASLSSEALQAFEAHFRWEHVRTNYRSILQKVSHA